MKVSRQVQSEQEGDNTLDVHAGEWPLGVVWGRPDELEDKRRSSVFSTCTRLRADLGDITHLILVT